MWKASADYPNGTCVERTFEFVETIPESIQQDAIMEWLLDQGVNPATARVELICK